MAPGLWRRWVRQPQSIAARRLMFQIHLWSGIGLGLYVLVIFLTGSVLVYRNELYLAFRPRPVIVAGAGLTLSAAQLAAAASRAYPGYAIAKARPGDTPSHAVELTLQRGGREIRRLFHPFTGADLGDPTPAGFRFTTWLLDLHDNLLAGDTGRHVNGLGALLLIVLCVSGAVVWWPGVDGWRRSLRPTLRTNWKGVTWRLHSALGFWSFAFVLMWGVTGTYLAFPDAFAALSDRIQPFDEANAGNRAVDHIQYWLAYLHFGRLGGRGIPGCGPGLCNSIAKATWAVVGLAGPAMFVTGVLMWWNRTIRQRERTRRHRSEPDTLKVAG